MKIVNIDFMFYWNLKYLFFVNIFYIIILYLVLVVIKNGLYEFFFRVLVLVGYWVFFWLIIE